MRKKNYTFWLVLTYIAMAVVCAALILFFKQDLTSIVINVAMFVIVAIIFLFAIRKFTIAWKMQKALSRAISMIKEDAQTDSRYLWNQYKDQGENALFPNNILTNQYKKFVTEMQRLEQYQNGDYKVNIEDFINKEYVDAAMKKNLLNLIPGTMTGLGILGTFIGLSFGLQFFNTGTAAEITDSIAPLMEGIKVAFHTSIYGMVFSLVFSFVYRGTMEAVYVQLDEFLNVFNTYVLGDSINDNESSMREMLHDLPETLGTAISEQMGQSLAPIVYNMNKTMMEFAQTISDNQAEGLRGLVNEFVEKMNQAMGDSYRQFAMIISDTCEIQKQNNQYAQNIMDKLGRLSSNIGDINTLSLKIIENMSGYISEVQKLQGIISENYKTTYRQMESLQQHEERMQGYVYSIAENEKEVNENIKRELEEVVRMSNVFSGEMTNSSKELTTMLSSARQDIENAVHELSSATVGLDDKLTTSLKETFDMFDSNMAQIAGHLSTTISQIESTTDKVPEVVLAAYSGMKQSFDAMQTEMKETIAAIKNMK